MIPVLAHPDLDCAGKPGRLRTERKRKWPVDGHNEMLARLQNVSFYTISNCWTRAMHR